MDLDKIQGRKIVALSNLLKIQESSQINMRFTQQQRISANVLHDTKAKPTMNSCTPANK